VLLGGGAGVQLIAQPSCCSVLTFCRHLCGLNVKSRHAAIFLYLQARSVPMAVVNQHRCSYVFASPQLFKGTFENGGKLVVKQRACEYLLNYFIYKSIFWKNLCC